MSAYSKKIRTIATIRKHSWMYDLTDRDRIRVAFTVRGRQVVALDLVQYEAEINGEWVAIVRYDMAHGYLHRDLMHPDGTREKRAIHHTSLADALTRALDYVQTHWEFYRAIYEEQ